MERPEQIRIVEALILASPEPISAARIGRITKSRATRKLQSLLKQLWQDKHG